MRQSDEIKLLRFRTAIVGYVVVVALGILTFGYWQHQLVQSRRYTELAERNRLKDIRLVAPRGRIFDRYDRVLADNRPSYDIVLIREGSPRTVEETAAMLAAGVEMSEEELLDRIARRRGDPTYRPIVLKQDATLAEIAFVRAHQYEMPEISVEFQPRRQYVEAGLAAHVMGYVGLATEAQLSGAEFAGVRSGDHVGQAGLERVYNAVLRGQDGFRRVVVNSVGREVMELQEVPPTPGNDLYTTLDLDLQMAAEEMIGDRVGAAVALDPRTGEVLALVSKPSYDPNLFPGISVGNWNALVNDPQRPLLNRAIQNHYAPGSVFKIFLAAAGLESKTIGSLEQVYCDGGANHYGHTYACWKAGGHGLVGLYQAIAESCNVFFYNLGRNLGIDKIWQYSTTMGLGRRTGIDLPNEGSGLIPSADWKQRVYNTSWYPGETISVSIGQGAVSVTPLQAAWAAGGLAAGGRLKQPHLVDPAALRQLGLNAPDVQSEEYPIEPTTVDLIGKAMWGTVNDVGTGSRARVEGFDVAGKTGTAQVVGLRTTANGNPIEDHAWFVGFAPYRNPEIVVAIFIEHGGGGGAAAAPVAQAIFETYYMKKTRGFEYDYETAPMAALNP